MATILETPRLRLREVTPGDLDTLAAMVADQDQMTFYPRPKTRNQARDWIDRNVALYASHGFGFWIIESRLGGHFLGYCGIRPFELDGDPETELGWHTKKTARNQGIATEAAPATLGLAFDRFGLSRLVAAIHPDHVASRRVAEKIGMSPGRTTVLDDYPCVIYTIERS